MATPEETIDAYLAAWNSPGEAERHRLLSEAVADECALTAPTGTFRGREAINELIVALQSRMEGATTARVGEMVLDENNPSEATFAWEVHAADGRRLFAGTDRVGLGGDGRLCRIHVAL